MAENVSSNVLFHFTGKMEYVKSILRHGFCARYCPEYTLDPVDQNRASKSRAPMYALPMVCFCDLPLSLIRKHLKEYGSFGIGLHKEWGVKHGVAPVIYTHLEAPTCQPVLRLISGAAEPGSRRAMQGVDVLAAYTKPFVGSAWRKGKVQNSVRFYDEREWRSVPDLREDEPLFLPWARYSNEAQRNELHERFKKRCSLPIPPDDIQYLILPYDKEEARVLEMHDFLKSIYRRRDAVLVTTTILTADCIEGDL